MRFASLTLIFLLAGNLALRAQPAEEGHPDTSGDAWSELFAPDLSNAIYSPDVWSVDDGVLTAAEDQEIWTEETYGDFVLDLEFKTAPGTNSGVILFADIDDWVPHSIEVQIADDFHETWANAPATWQAGAIFGHVPPDTSVVRPPGEWNRMTISSRNRHVSVVLNGEKVSEMEMDRWQSASTNPDGSEIPSWLRVPKAELPAHGHIGLQGKHGDAPIWFRNLRIRDL
ncbi:MAG: 3-keto-disaccharide hydrolase [Bacteroidota bacterium]